MAPTTKVTEPATPVEASEPVIEPAIPDNAVKHDPRKLVYVTDTTSGTDLPNPVPQTWLDGRFPHLKATPTKKAGK